MSRRAVFLLAVLLLAGCGTAPTRPPPDDRDQAWQRHRAAVAGLEKWRLTGRIAIHTQGEGWHATLDWRQEPGQYDIRLIAPLGQGSVRLQGQGGQVALHTEEGTSYAGNAEALLYRRLGWRVPVEALRHWVLGLPAPGAVAERRLDAYGRLAYLEQADWKIEFREYTGAAGRELPERVFVSNHRARVRLAVGRWRVSGFK